MNNFKNTKLKIGYYSEVTFAKFCQQMDLVKNATNKTDKRKALIFADIFANELVKQQESKLSKMGV